MALRCISILAASAGIFAALGCYPAAEDFATLTLVNDIDAPVVAYAPLMGSKHLPSCERREVFANFTEPGTIEWTFFANEFISTNVQMLQGDFELLRANIGAELFRFHMTGGELEQADFTVHFKPNMASESIELGRTIRNLPCPEK